MSDNVVELPTKLMARIKETEFEADSAGLNMTMALLPIMADAIRRMREAGASGEKIGRLLRHAADELQGVEN